MNLCESLGNHGCLTKMTLPNRTARRSTKRHKSYRECKALVLPNHQIVAAAAARPHVSAADRGGDLPAAAAAAAAAGAAAMAGAQPERVSWQSELSIILSLL